MTHTSPTISAQEACRLITAYASIDDQETRIEFLRAMELHSEAASTAISD